MDTDRIDRQGDSHLTPIKYYNDNLRYKDDNLLNIISLYLIIKWCSSGCWFGPKLNAFERTTLLGDSFKS